MRLFTLEFGGARCDPFQKGPEKKAEKHSDHYPAHIQYHLSVSKLCLYYKKTGSIYFSDLLRLLFSCP